MYTPVIFCNETYLLCPWFIVFILFYFIISTGHILIRIMCVLLPTSSQGFHKLWGDYITTSYIGHYWPRLIHLLLHSLLIEPVPPYIPTVQFLSRGGRLLLPCHPIHWRVSAQYHAPNRASPVSIPAYQKTFTRLPFTSQFQITSTPPRPCLCHSRQISVSAAPLLPLKYLLTWLSSVVKGYTLRHFNPRQRRLQPKCSYYV